MDIDSLFQDARGALIEVDFYCSSHGDTPLMERLQNLDVRLRPLVAFSDAADMPTLCRAVERLCTLLKRHAGSPVQESLLLPITNDIIDSLRYGVHAWEQMKKGNINATPEPPAYFEAAFDMVFRQLEQYLRHPRQSPPSRGLRILIADDEVLIRDVLRHHLGNQGHLVLTVTDGAAGINALASNYFDVMLTDINMPRANGIDVLKAAREMEVDAEVIVITGYASMQNAAEAVRYGAYDYLVKPFSDPDLVLGSVRRAADQVRLKRQNRRLIVDLHHKNERMTRYARHLEEALQTVREKNRALLHADRMATLGVLAAGVAHEINNPTTFIRGNIQTLQKFWDTIATLLRDSLQDNPMKGFILDEVPGLLQDMFIGTERIAKITNGLCSYARREVEPVREPFRIEACVEEALRMTHNATRDKVHVECVLPETPELVGDRQQIVQVLVNLILNAVDAMENRVDARLQIVATPVEDGVEFGVEDNGPGIPAEIRDRVFDPFFTTKTVGRGTGMGLSVVLGIVHAHGGHIHVWSEPGKGAHFTVFLPVRAGTTDDGKPLILLAAPDTVITQTLVQGFRFQDSFGVEWIRQADEVWARCTSAEPPRLVILDMHLHGLGVFDLLRRLQDSPKTKGIPILVLTEDALPGMMERIKRGGAARVFLTPVRLDDLTASITELLHQDSSTVRFDPSPTTPALPDTENADD